MENTKLWSKPAKYLITASDTEFVSKPGSRNKMITTQLASSADTSNCVVLEHPTLGLGLLPTWNTTCILPTVLGWVEDRIEEKLADAYLIWDVLCFFSPADVLAGLFNDDELCVYIQRYCKQDGRITIDNGSKRRYDKTKNLLPLKLFLTEPGAGIRYQLVLKITDLAKLGAGSLKSIASSLGVEMKNKDKMDEYKTRMLDAYKDDTLINDFIAYGKDDACILFEVKAKAEIRQKILYETIALEPNDKVKMTVGSMIAQLFQDWLKDKVDSEAFEKPGYECFRTTRDKAWNFTDLLERCGVKHFATSSAEFTNQTNALVQGGRAKNERPTTIFESGVIADADFSSCYATVLQNLTYPIGIPVTYNKHKSEKKAITLGSFLKEHKDDLIPRLYTIVVSGKLKHNQTLVPSKIADNFQITEKYSEDDPKIPAEFRLYTQEVINGVITSDILEILEAVCNRNEYSQWMRLEVITACWYPKSLQAPDLKSWNLVMESVEEENKVIVSNDKEGKPTQKDRRSRVWVGIPIGDFITPFKEKRTALKVKRNAIADKNDPEWAVLNAQQEGMKLVCNNLYGVLASPYFPISNVVVANNITASVRAACWCLQVATGAYQSITDGGAYNLNQVRDWSGETTPSMNTLSLWRNSENLHRAEKGKLITKPLASDTLWLLEPSEKGKGYSVLRNAGEPVYEAKSEGWEFIDEALLAHIKHFFRSESGYPTILDIVSISHKDIYASITLHSQTNYQFKTSHGEYLEPKARGYKTDGTPYNNDTEESNINQLFADLRQHPTAVPAYKPQTIGQVLKINQANEKLMAKTSNIVKEKGLLAGDSIEERSWVRPISLSMFHWKSDAQYKSWDRKANNLRQKTGYGVEQHFLNHKTGKVNYKLAVETIQARIDKGEMWIVKADKSRAFPNHPYLPTKQCEFQASRF